ncbi:hypothetical protein ACS127_13200 [Amphibacillus sp. Q70]|uniref:hypothetical protein n=1 Tax=Amphibacillus sp. Q70 TaxID=3453416 RepID=UPI003F83471C
MKKKLYGIVLVLSVLLLSACSGSKTALSAEEFQAQMEEAGYEIHDAFDQFPEGSVESVLLAANDDYQIEFYVVLTVEQAQSAFNENKDSFESEKGNVSTDSSVSLSNYSVYKQTTNGQYYVVSRVENTFIYVVTPDENKQAVNDVLETLGY